MSHVVTDAAIDSVQSSSLSGTSAASEIRNGLFLIHLIHSHEPRT